MKIAWIVPGFQSDETDRCIPALTDLAHQIGQRHHLKVFALQYPSREASYKIGAVEVQSFTSSSQVQIAKFSRIGPVARAVKTLRHESFDIIHAFWGAEPALVGVCATLFTKKNIPLIVACMGGETVYLPQIGYGTAQKRYDQVCLWLAVSRAQVITAGSEIQKELLRSKFGAKVQPVVMPLGVDLTRFKPLLSERNLPSEPVMLAVGSLLPVKAHDRLIQAVENFPELLLTIVGEGRERANLEALIKRLGLQKRVTLVGAIPAQEMPKHYASADFLALPSYYESQCVALLEGLACGLPAIAAPVGIAPSLLKDHTAGELAADNSPAALTTAIRSLLQRSSEWSQLRLAARAKAESMSLTICSERLLELYEAVSQKGGNYASAV